MIRLWHSHRIALTGFVLAALVTLFFLVRLAVQTVYWADPAHQHLVPQPWMTVGYVARSWGIAPDDLADATGLPSPHHTHGHSTTLTQIAADRGMTVEELIAQIQAAITKIQAGEAQN